MPFEIWNDHIEVGFVVERYSQFKFDVFKMNIYKLSRLVFEFLRLSSTKVIFRL